MAGTQYNYSVAAVVSSCTSALSSCDSATTDSPPPGSCPAGYNQYDDTAPPDLITASCSASGLFDATLTCNSNPSADLDLYLDKYTCAWIFCSWGYVDVGGTAGCNEVINYNGTSGTYRWRVNAYSGSTTFTLCTNQC